MGIVTTGGKYCEACGHAPCSCRGAHVGAEYPTAFSALARIARGRCDNGRPLGGETARHIAREALTDLGIGW